MDGSPGGVKYRAPNGANKELTMMLTPMMSKVSRKTDAKNIEGTFDTCQVHIGMNEWRAHFLTIAI